MEKDTLTSSVDNSEVGHEYGDVWSPTPLTDKQLKALKLWQHKQELRYQSRIAKENFKENRENKFLTFKMEKRVLERKHRKSDKDEMDVLFEVLKANFLLQVACEFTSQRGYDDYSIQDFLHSKRPFGNKDVESSIAYKLDWNYDYDDEKYAQLSPAVRKEAERIFNLLDKEMLLKTGRFSYDMKLIADYTDRIINLKIVKKENI